MTNLNKIKEGLLQLQVPVYRYHAAQEARPPYIVWAEDGANDLIADGIHAESAIEGTIDLYSAEEEDELVRKIQDKLNDIGCAWYLASVQFEEETGIIHHEWVFQI